MKTPRAKAQVESRPGRRSYLLWPLIVFVAAKLLVGLVAWRAGADPLDAASYARWDSGHYLTIATRGYDFGPCAPKATNATKVTAETAAAAPRACGNVAWLPGYSLLIRALEGAGLPGPPAGLAISALAHLALLILLGRRLAGFVADPRRRALLLGIGAFFPGMIYYHAIFPVALFTLFACAFLLDLEGRRFARAAGWGAAAAFSYTPGILLGGAAGICALIDFAWPPSGNGARAPRLLFAWALAVLGPLLGFAAALLMQFLDTGALFGFFVLQNQYGRAAEPFTVIAWLAEQLFTSPYPPVRIAAFQSLATGAAVIALLWFARPRRTTAAAQGLVPYAFVCLLLLWLLPLSIGRGLSLYRSEACLMPAALLLLARTDSTPGLPVLIGGFLFCLVLGLTMADLFFRNLLV